MNTFDVKNYLPEISLIRDEARLRAAFDAVFDQETAR